MVQLRIDDRNKTAEIRGVVSRLEFSQEDQPFGVVLALWCCELLRRLWVDVASRKTSKRESDARLT